MAEFPDLGVNGGWLKFKVEINITNYEISAIVKIEFAIPIFMKIRIAIPIVIRSSSEERSMNAD